MISPVRESLLLGQVLMLHLQDRWIVRANMLLVVIRGFARRGTKDVVHGFINVGV